MMRARFRWALALLAILSVGLALHALTRGTAPKPALEHAFPDVSPADGIPSELVGGEGVAIRGRMEVEPHADSRDELEQGFVVRVIDQDGDPLSNVVVSGFLLLNDEVFHHQSMITDVDGTSWVPAPEPGEWILRANGQSQQPGYSLNGSSHHLAAGEVKRLDLELQRLSASLTVLVQDERGVPVEGVEVHVAGSRPDQRTDVLGRATFPQLWPRATSVSLTDNKDLRCAIPADNRQQVDLAPENASLVIFDLKSRPTLTLHLDPAGSTRLPELQVFTVTLHSLGKEYRSGWKMTHVRTGEPTIIRDLAPGEYRVTCDARCDEPCFVRERIIELHPGTDHEHTVRLEPAKGVVSGRLVDRDGLPVSPASVSIYADPSADPRVELVPSRKGMGVDENGEFTFLGVPDVPLRLFVDVRLYSDQGSAVSRPLAWFGTAEKPYMELEGPTNDLVITMARGFRIQVDAPEGRPDCTARIDRKWYARETEGYMEGDHFEFNHLREGSYELWFEEDGREGPRKTVQLGGSPNSPELMTVALELPPD